MKREARAQSQRRATLLLAAGATAGLALAAFDILRVDDRARGLPVGAVALVNGQALSRDDYERTLAALSTDRRDAVDDAERRRVLDRLIDEELLLQHGQDLGLVRRDPRVRGDLAAAVIDVATSEAAAREPTDAELERFYEANRDRFAIPGRIRVRQVLVRVPPDESEATALERAKAAAARLRAGEDFATVAGELGDAEIAALPDAPLPPVKLREYLGPTATRAALHLAAGEISDPVRSSAGYHVLDVVDRDPAAVPPLDQVTPEVRAEWKRENGDRALREYLEELRARARVVVAEAE